MAKVIISTKKRAELCQKWGITPSYVSRVLCFHGYSSRQRAIRTDALNNFNGFIDFSQ